MLLLTKEITIQLLTDQMSLYSLIKVLMVRLGLLPSRHLMVRALMSIEEVLPR